MDKNTALNAAVEGLTVILKQLNARDRLLVIQGLIVFLAGAMTSPRD